jgi:hypothetical protein
MMRGYRFRIALLALGVLFGYGSAIRHLAYGHGHWQHRAHEHCAFHDSDHDTPERPAKPVQ